MQQTHIQNMRNLLLVALQEWYANAPHYYVHTNVSSIIIIIISSSSSSSSSSTQEALCWIKLRARNVEKLNKGIFRVFHSRWH